MSRLQVYLCLESLPTLQPAFATLLSQLAQITRFHLTVINNGQPFEPRRMLHQLGWNCQTLDFPLQFHPAQILLHLLESEAPDGPVLWLQDRVLWHPQALLSWREKADEWAWIAPHLLPEKTRVETRRLYQQQALNAPESPGHLELAQSNTFSPCLYFEAESQSILIDWLQPQGQLPLLQLGASDLGSPAWHPEPASEPTQTEFVLELSEALERWEQALEPELKPQRRLALWSSLQRAFPDSPAVYAQLLPLLSPAEVVEMVQPLLRRGRIYPAILDAQIQALQHLEHKELAAYLERMLRERFPAYVSQPVTWKPSSHQPEIWGLERLPRAATLSLCTVLRPGDRGIQKTLASVAEAVNEVIVIDAGAASTEVEAAQRAGAQVYPLSASSAAGLSRAALKQACCNWVLFMEAGETLNSGNLTKLRQWLWETPPGLQRYSVELQSYNEAGELRQIQQFPRLFPRHRMFDFVGEAYAELVLTGPVDTPLGQSHLVLQRHLQASESRGLSFLEPPAPESLDIRGLMHWSRQLFAQADFGRASSYYQAALNQGDLPPLALMQLQMEWLWCLWEQGHLTRCQSLLQALEYASQHPEYPYFLGVLRLKLGDSEGAQRAFQDALSASIPLGVWAYDPRKIKLWPRCHLLQLLRGKLLQLERSPRQRARAASQALDLLQSLLKHFPDGILRVPELFPAPLNLYLYLAEVAWLGAGLLFESPLRLFRDALPAHSEGTLAFHAETALLLLDEQFLALADRLPSDLGFEALQNLVRNPSELHHFAESLWQRVEIDGAELAEALLYVIAVARQDISLLLRLSRLWASVGAQIRARYALADVLDYFGADPYLLHFYVRLLIDQQDQTAAEKALEKALAQDPDFEPLRMLQEQLKKENNGN